MRQELRAIVALAPLVPVDLDMPWSSQVFMTDASWYGQGVFTRHLPEDDLAHEAALAETRATLAATQVLTSSSHASDGVMLTPPSHASDDVMLMPSSHVSDDATL